MFEYRGEIVTVPMEKGDDRNLTQSVAANDRVPVWSPDGKSIAWVTDESGENELRIAVKDRGPGVPDALKGKIFARFFTTDADRHGTGLGLAIVESVAEAHGGKVELDSKEGEGATFTMILRSEKP